MPEVNLFYQQLEEQCGPDYIKVIRCKDCREYDTTGYDTPEFGYCRCLKREVQDGFYCGHGEKGDANDTKD